MITLRKSLAIVLLGLFGLQSAVRLVGMTPLFQRLSIEFATVHALDLAALAGVAILRLRLARDRVALMIALALVLGAIEVVLSGFDAASLVAIRFHQRVTTLPAIATFYCNQDSIRACLVPYPGVAAAIAMLWVGWAGLIVVAADALNALTGRLLQPLPLGGRAPRLPLLLVTAGVVLWGTAWLVRFDQIALREPLVRFVMKSPLGPQPRALITLPRPDYQVMATAGAKPRPLVLIVIDSLRADAVELRAGQPSRTPFLQALAAGGALHDYGPAAAICSTSYCGITGVLSSSDWATLQKGPPLMIADVLAANGYTSHYLLSGPHRRALNFAALYGPHVTTMLDDSSPDSSGLIDDREQVRRLRALKLADPARSFVFIHLMSAHAAGLRFDRNPASPSMFERLLSSTDSPGPYIDYYDRGVRQSDLIIRQVFAILKTRDMLREALVVITADHGERLSGEIGHGGGVDLSTALIPLLVYDPKGGVWPAARAGMASQIDAAPTLLAAAGIITPAQWQGRALQSGVVRPAAPSDALQESALVGRIDGHVEMVRCDLATGRLHMPGNAADPQALAALPGWWSGLARRDDDARCREPRKSARYPATGSLTTPAASRSSGP